MNAKRLVILTGASRGLGAAIARQLLQPGVSLLTLSRHPDATLDDAVEWIRDGLITDTKTMIGLLWWDRFGVPHA